MGQSTYSESFLNCLKNNLRPTRVSAQEHGTLRILGSISVEYVMFSFSYGIITLKQHIETLFLEFFLKKFSRVFN